MHSLGERTSTGRRALVVLGLCTVLAPIGSEAQAAPPKPRVLISGVYIHGYLPGVPSPDSAVRLINLDGAQPADIAGCALTDDFTPRKERKGRPKNDLVEDEDLSEGLGDAPPVGKPGRGRPKQDRVLRFPEGARIPPGGEIWVAATAQGFTQIFGEAPAYEASDTDPKVPDVDPAKGFLWLNEGYGTVALLDRNDRAIDFVAWQGPKQDGFPDGAFDEVPWNGGPVELKLDTDFGWTGRVLGRARDEQGGVLADTDRASDWPVGFSRMQLGTMPTHRVELAGQSRFVARPLTGVRAKVLATSAPDNNYAALIRAFESAKKELRVRVYELTSPKIAESLIKAKRRGVKVLLYLEGSPVAGISDQERWLVDRLSKAGIPVHFMATPKDITQKPRFRFDHSKYVLVDDRLAVIGTENYGRTGVPIDPSFGNRGWMIHVEQPDFVRQLRAVWDHDYRPGVMADVLSIDASTTDTYGLPYRDPSFVPSEKLPSGFYPNPLKPVAVDDTMGLELVLAPDTSLNENTAILGMIARAQTSLIIEQNSVLPFWGKQKKDGDSAQAKYVDPIQSLPLQAVVAAARRGVKVRALLDGTWYNAEATDERDNDNTVNFLNELAEKEGLDIAAKVINLESTHLEKIHAKGVIVDDREVFVGSINWSENSFVGNREVGVIVTHPKVAGYYADLFRRDWSQSRLYTAALTGPCDIRERPDAASRIIGKKKAGERVEVVHERGKLDGGAAWAEVELGFGVTGFIPGNVLGVAEVSARETMFVMGREAIVTGKVEDVRATDKVTLLRFTDPERPPFVAVIFKKDEAAFIAAGLPPATAFLGKEVRLRGKVKVYTVPEIILSRPKDIEVVTRP